jgi:RHS repeat-associated protein
MLSATPVRPEYFLVAAADYNPADQFTIATEYSPTTGAPRAILSLREDLGANELNIDLQKIALELRLGDMVLQSQIVLVDIAEDAFLGRFRGDRVNNATQMLPELATFGADSGINAGGLTLTKLLDTNGFAKGRNSGAVDDSVAAVFYTTFAAAVLDAAQREDVAASAEEYGRAGEDRRALSVAAVLLNDRLRRDAQSGSLELAGAARQLQEILSQSGEFALTAFSGFGVNQELISETRADGEFVLALVEATVYEATSSLTVQLGGRSAMVQATVSSTASAPPASAALTLQNSSPIDDVYVTYLDSNLNYSSDIFLLVGYPASEDEAHALLQFDLTSWAGGATVPTEADLILSAQYDSDAIPNVVSAHWNMWGFSNTLNPADLWNEDTLNWDEYDDDLLSGFRAPLDTVTVAPDVDNAFSVTEAVQRALLGGDANFDGELAAITPGKRGDVEAMYLAVRDWDRYTQIYGGLELVEDGLLYRTDINWDGVVDQLDFTQSTRRLGFSWGDFNLDGLVDINDHSIWQQNYGKRATTYSEGDANANGYVDDGDLTLWSLFEDETHSLPWDTKLTLRIAPDQFGPDGAAMYGVSGPNPSTGPRLSVEAESKALITGFTPSSSHGVRVEYTVLNESQSNELSLTFEVITPEGTSAVLTPRANLSGSVGEHFIELSAAELVGLPVDQEYTLVARLASATNTSSRQFDGGLFVDADDTWRYHGHEGVDDIAVWQGYIWVSGKYEQLVHVASTGHQLAHFQAQLGDGDDSVTLGFFHNESAWVAGGAGDDSYDLDDEFSTGVSLVIEDAGGFDTLGLNGLFNGQAVSNALDLRSRAPQLLAKNALGPEISVVFANADAIQYVVHSNSMLAIDGLGYDDQDFVVDTLGSDFDGVLTEGNLELREAIELANYFAGLNVIKFAEELFAEPSVIALGDDWRTFGPDPLRIADHLQIDGPGNGLLTIDGEQRESVFYSGTYGTTVSLRDLTVANGKGAKSGHSGGFTLTSGSLSLDHVSFVDNQSSVAGFGGAINAINSTVAIVDSTLDGNEATYGGAIRFQSTLPTTLTIKNSTISNNTSKEIGSAVYIYSNVADVLIENSTISGNTSINRGGAVIVGGSAASASGTTSETQIVNSTITNNRAKYQYPAGLWNNSHSQVYVDNTIIAENYHGTGNAWYDLRRQYADGLFHGERNLYGVFAGQFESTDQLVLGVAQSAGLSVLGNYGGPTKTHSLLSGSPAIDGGSNLYTLTDTDQRGRNRVVDGDPDTIPGSVVDIGAYEYEFATAVNATVPFLAVAEGFDGTAPTGQFNFTNSGGEIGYLNFDLRQQLAEIDTLDPELKFWVGLPPGTTIQVAIWSTSNSWNESSQAFPSPILLLGTAVVEKSGYVTFSTSELTDYVRQQQELGETTSFAISVTFIQGSTAVVRSRHNDNYSARPQLVVTGEFYNNELPTPQGASPDLIADYPPSSANPTKFFYGNVLKNDTDPNGAVAFRAELVTPTKLGKITLSQYGDFTYKAFNGASGFDEFTYRVFDGFGWSQPQKVRLSVSPVRTFVFEGGISPSQMALFDEATVLEAFVEAGALSYPVHLTGRDYYVGYGQIPPPVPSPEEAAAEIEGFRELLYNSTPISLNIDIMGDEELFYAPASAPFGTTNFETAPYDNAQGPMYWRRSSDEYPMFPLSVQRGYQEAESLDADFLATAPPNAVFGGVRSLDVVWFDVDVTSSLQFAIDNDLGSYGVSPLTGGSNIPGILYSQYGGSLAPFFIGMAFTPVNLPKLYVRAVLGDDTAVANPNTRPEFTSNQINTAEVGEAYSYTMTATDEEASPLVFSFPTDLIHWPEELGVDPNDIPETYLPKFEQTSWVPGAEKAVLTWDPPAELAGKSITFYERVSDGTDVTLRPLTITVAPIEHNDIPPVVIGNPDTNYHVPVDYGPRESTDVGVVDPLSISVALADGGTITVPVSVTASEESLTSQIVFALDSSSSMTQGFSWLKDNIELIDQQLGQAGFATRQYGFVAFGIWPDTYPAAPGDDIWVPLSFKDGSGELMLVSDWEVLFDALDSEDFPPLGGTQPGYLALEKSLAYPLTPNASTAAQIVVITDDQETSTDYSSKDAVREAIFDKLVNTSSYYDDIVLTFLGDAHYSGVDTVSGALSGWQDVSTAGGEVQSLSSGLQFSANGPAQAAALAPANGLSQASLYQQLFLDASFEIEDDIIGAGVITLMLDWREGDYNYLRLDLTAPGEATYTFGSFIAGVDTVEWSGSYGPASSGLLASDNLRVTVTPRLTQGASYPYAFSINGREFDVLDASGTQKSYAALGGPYPGQIGVIVEGGSAVLSNLEVGDGQPSFSSEDVFSFYASETAWRSSALGISSNDAYLLGPDGDFIRGTDSRVDASYGEVQTDYVDVAIDSGGSAWDYNILRNYVPDSPINDSFANAFADTIARQARVKVLSLQGDESDPDSSLAIKNIRYIGRTAVADIGDGTPGYTYDYEVTFQGDGVSRAFSLQVLESALGGAEPGDPIAEIPVQIDAPYSADFDVLDPDGVGPYTFELIGDSHGATLRDSGRPGLKNDRLVWDPPIVSEPVDYDFWVTVRDVNDVYAVNAFPWTVRVNPPDENTSAPVITGAIPTLDGDPASFLLPDAMERRAYSFTVVASDEDGDRPRFYLTDDAPAGMSIDRNTGEVFWIPTRSYAGKDVTFTVAVTDGRLIKHGLLDPVTAQSTHTFTIDVKTLDFGNHDPVLASISDRYVRAGSTLTIEASDIKWSDLDGDDPYFDIVSGPSALVIDHETGAMAWTPNEGDALDPYKLYPVQILIDDRQGGKAYQDFIIAVAPSNFAPDIVQIGDWDAITGLSNGFEFRVSDRDGQTVSVELVGAADWISLQSPDSDELGKPYKLLVDIDKLFEARSLVDPLDELPLVSVTDTFRIVASDGLTGVREFPVELGYTLETLPPPLFSGAPTFSGTVSRAISYDFSITSRAELDLDTLALDIASQGRDITIDKGDVTYSELTNGDYLYTGFKLNWTPTAAGVFDVQISVTDDNGVGGSFSPVFTIGPGAAPVLYGRIPGAAVGELWTLNVGDIPLAEGVAGLWLADPDGPSGAVTFKIVEGPEGVQVDNSSLLEGSSGSVITWTPPAGADAASPHHFEFELTDADGNKATYDFDLPVAPDGEPVDPGLNDPTTQQNDPDAPEIKTKNLGPYYVGLRYNIQLNAEGQDGTSLNYAIVYEESNLPEGMAATFDAINGWFVGWRPTTTGDDYTLTLLVTDSYQRSTKETIHFQVVPKLSDPPKINPGFPKPVVEGKAWAHQIVLDDDNIDAVKLTLSEPTAAAGFELVGPGQIEAAIMPGPLEGWWLLLRQPGKVGTTYQPRVTIEDPGAFVGTFGFQAPLVVFDEENAPQPLPGQITLAVGQEFRYGYKFAGADADLYQLVAIPTPNLGTELPPGLVVIDNEVRWIPSGESEWFNPDPLVQQDAPTGGWSADYPVTFVVVKQGEANPVSSISTIFHVVKPADAAPETVKIDRTTTPKDRLSYDKDLAFALSLDESGTGAITWTLEQGPEGASIGPAEEPATGLVIHWTPGESMRGERVQFVLRAEDSLGVSDVLEFSVLVTGLNQKPKIGATLPSMWVKGVGLGLDLRANDPEGAPLGYQVLTLGGVPFGPSDWGGSTPTVDDGWLAWTPDTSFVGVREFVIRVSEVDDPTFFTDVPVNIRVMSGLPNSWRPIIQGNPSGAVLTAGTEFKFEFGVLDIDAVAEDFGGSNFGVLLVDGVTFDNSLGGPHEGVNFTYDSGTGVGTFLWTPSDADVGDKSFQLFASDGANTGFRNFTLKVKSNSPPQITAPTLLNAVQGGLLVRDMTASASNGGELFYSLEGAPAGMTINNATGELRWRVPKDQAAVSTGPYTLVVEDTEGRKSTHAFTINVAVDSIAPTISFYIEDTTADLDAQTGRGRTILPSDPLDATHYSDYRIWIDVRDNVSSTSNVLWDLVLEDSATLNGGGTSPVNITDQTGGLWSLDFTGGLNQGLLRFTLTAEDGAATPNQARQVFTYYAEDPGNNSAKIATDLSGVIEETVEIRGTALSNGTYNVKLTSLDDPSEFVWLAKDELAEADGGYLATIDPSLYRSGVYRLYLEVQGDGGGIQGIDERIIEIRNDGQVGSLDLSFTDLSVDLGGIPVSLTRSYSSALVSSDRGFYGDFGPGWTMELLESSISVSHPKQVTQALTQPIARETRVSVRMPDGSIERFTFRPQATSSGGQGPYTPFFDPDYETTSTLEISGQSELRLRRDSDRNDDTYYEADSGEAFSLDRFAQNLVLTTRSGVRYVFDATTGELTAIEDQNEQRVTIDRYLAVGETYPRVEISAGGDSQDFIEIQFEEYYELPAGGFVENGEEGAIRRLRIKEIRDPAAINDVTKKPLKYEYGQFDLTDPTLSFVGLKSFFNRAENETVYSYDSNFKYHLTEIVDPSGVAVLTAVYTLPTMEDAGGRLKNIVDAGGQASEVFTLKLSGGLTLTRVTSNGEGTSIDAEEVRDRRGALLRRIQKVSATGEAVQYLVTVYKYDSEGRLTHESLPFIATSESDRLDKEPPLTVQDVPNSAWARITQYDSDGRGLPVKVTDAYGNSTQYVYDDLDRVITTIDVNDVESHNVYDASTGNLIESYVQTPDSTVRYNHTRFVYDQGRVVVTYRVDGDNEFLLSETDYDVYGHVQWTKDSRGNKRYYLYDTNGQQTHSWSNWTNGVDDIATVSFTVYDGEGRVKETYEYEVEGEFDESTAQSNFTSAFANSAVSTLVSSSETIYDDATGRVDRTIDRYEARTIYAYDKRGALVQTLTETTDEDDVPGWIVTRTVYDGFGRVAFVTDPVWIADPDSTIDAAVDLASVPVTWYGTRTIYDQLGREEFRGRWKGVEVSFTSDGSGIGLFSTAVETDWDNPPGGTVRLSHSQTIYDDFGRVEASVSETGARTDYYYDVGGRQVAVLGPEVTIEGALTRALTLSVFDTAGRLFQSWVNIAVEATVDHPSLTINGSSVSTSDSANITTIHVEDARVTHYEYDILGRQTAVITPLVDHDQDGDAATPTPRVHLRTETQYDNLGRRIATSEGIVQRAVASPASIDYRDATTTDYEYNQYGDLVAVTLPAVEHPTLREVDAAGDAIVISDSYGVPITIAALVRPRYEYEYDGYGNRVRIIDNILVASDGRVLRNHDAYNVPADISADESRTTEFAYDQKGRQVTRTLPLGVQYADGSFTERMKYGDTALSATGTVSRSVIVGQLEKSVDFEGRVTEYYYDNSPEGGGRLVEARYFQGDGSADGDSFDPIDNNDLVEIVNYAYDAYGRRVKTDIDRDFDPTSQSPSNVDHTTQNDYDDQGRLVAVATEDGNLHSTVHYDYSDVTDLMIAAWTTASSDPMVTTVVGKTSYAYDALGRLTDVVSDQRNGQASGDVTHYSYDLLGNLKRTETNHASASDIVATDYVFDELSRLVEQRNYLDKGDAGYDPGDTLYGYYAYQLDSQGRRIASQQIDDLGVDIAFAWLYDSLGRLVGESVDYDTDDAGETPPGTSTNPISNDSYTHYIYDLVGNRIQKLTHNDATVQPSRNGVHYDQATLYEFDANDRLLRESDIGYIYASTVNLPNDLEFWYRPSGIDGYSFDGFDVSFYHYGEGDAGTQRTSKNTYYLSVLGASEPASGGQIEVSTYDVRGRLATTDSHSYSYDDDGVRIRQTVYGAESNYVVSTNNPTGYSQVLEERDINGSTRVTFMVGHDVLLQETHYWSSSDTHQFLYDGHGSTRGLLSALGSQQTTFVVAQRYLYEAYGEFYSPLNPTSSGPDGYGNNYTTSASQASTSVLYAGEWVDKNGLGYNRARYLDFGAGIWTLLDPFLGDYEDPQSLNKYSYVHNNPINGIDPIGEAIGELGQSSVAALDEAAIAAQLAGQAYLKSTAPFPPGWRAGGPPPLVNPATGLRIAAYQNLAKKEIYLAFAGTDDFADVIHDARQGIGLPSSQYTEALTYAAKIKAAVPPGWKLTFTGHSLGGGLAALAAGVHRVQAITFNAASLHPTTLKSHGVSSVTLRNFVTAYHVMGDPVTSAEGIVMGAHTGRYGTVYALPAQTGINSLSVDLHKLDAVTWGINDLRTTILGGGSISDRIRGFNNLQNSRLLNEMYRALDL